MTRPTSEVILRATRSISLAPSKLVPTWGDRAWTGMVLAMGLEFGIFDHLDRNDLPLRDYYEQRLQVIEAFDRLGFYAYHVAEHHFTPLGMAPSPSVFLSAIAQRTTRFRMGTFVYALPAHHPLRVLQEDFMLDPASSRRAANPFLRGPV